jgi:hypothetical protein
MIGRSERSGTLYRGSSQRWERLDLRFAEHLFDKTREIARRVVEEEQLPRDQVVRPLLDEAPVERSRTAFLLRTADILSAVLGVTLVLVGSRE